MGLMYDLNETIRKEIITCCKKYHVNKIILFGSRARGDNTPHSDIDLAIEGAYDFDHLYADLKYNEFTLLDMDIINLNANISEPLMRDISTDGCILYEKGHEHESKN